jgi:hypothetical protein
MNYSKSSGCDHDIGIDAAPMLRRQDRSKQLRLVCMASVGGFFYISWVDFNPVFRSCSA